MPMNPEIKAQWVAALRSGDYKQGRSELKSYTGYYCCLGVACDLAVKAGVTKETYYPDIREYRFNSIGFQDLSSLILPIGVAGWLGINSTDPEVVVTNTHPKFSQIPAKVGPNVRPHVKSVKVRLSFLNDQAKFTFNEIADLIEEQL